MADAVTMKKVQKRFKGKEAVIGISFALPVGRVVALLGPNGAGKTTTVSMLLGLLRPNQGEVRVLGNDPCVAAHRAGLGAMLQQVDMPAKLRVREVVNLFRSCYNHPLGTAELLQMAGLSEFANEYARKLSGGQQRRLQFALAMAGDPKVVFLDEPTTGMDVTSRRLFWDSLRNRVASQHRTVLFTTHHLEEADQFADRILVMHQGKLVADGTPDEIKSQTGKRYISFLPSPEFNLSQLESLLLVDEISQIEGRVRIRTQDSDALLRTLILGRFDMTDIRVSVAGLEEAFVELTGGLTQDQTFEGRGA